MKVLVELFIFRDLDFRKIIGYFLRKQTSLESGLAAEARTISHLTPGQSIMSWNSCGERRACLKQLVEHSSFKKKERKETIVRNPQRGQSSSFT